MTAATTNSYCRTIRFDPAVADYVEAPEPLDATSIRRSWLLAGAGPLHLTAAADQAVVDDVVSFGNFLCDHDGEPGIMLEPISKDVGTPFLQVRCIPRPDTALAAVWTAARCLKNALAARGLLLAAATYADEVHLVAMLSKPADASLVTGLRNLADQLLTGTGVRVLADCVRALPVYGSLTTIRDEHDAAVRLLSALHDDPYPPQALDDNLLTEDSVQAADPTGKPVAKAELAETVARKFEALEWDTPQPLQPVPDPWPVDALPPVLAETAEVIAAGHDVPFATAAAAVLGSVSSALGASFAVEAAPGHTVHGNLLWLLVGPWGPMENVVQAALDPMTPWATRQHATYLPELHRFQDQRRLFDSYLHSLIQEMQRQGVRTVKGIHYERATFDEARQLLTEIYQKQLSAPPNPSPLVRNDRDVTDRLLHDHVLAFLGSAKNMLWAVPADVWLAGADGLVTDIPGRGWILYMPKEPCRVFLSALLYADLPDVGRLLHEFDRAAEVLTRFLPVVAVPTGTEPAGLRHVRGLKFPAGYEPLLHQLLERRLEHLRTGLDPVAVDLHPEARELSSAFGKESVTAEQVSANRSGDPDLMKQWIVRAPDTALKTALVLAAASDPVTPSIDPDTMAAAIRIVRCVLTHAETLCWTTGGIGEQLTQLCTWLGNNTRALRRAREEEKAGTITAVKVQDLVRAKAVGISTAAEAEKLLAVLASRGLAHRLAIPRKRGRPTVLYILHPAFSSHTS